LKTSVLLLSFSAIAFAPEPPPCLCPSWPAIELHLLYADNGGTDIGEFTLSVTTFEDLEDKNFSVEAVLSSDEDFWTVVFDFADQDPVSFDTSNYKTENNYPYYLNGDIGGGSNVLTVPELGEGIYFVRATVYFDLVDPPIPGPHVEGYFAIVFEDSDV
jgi:hypothetical protein